MRLTSRPLLAPSLAVIALFLAACSDDDEDSTGPGPTPVQAATVDATPSIQFTPSSVVLARGGKVTFRFAGVPHNVFFDNATAGAPANITGSRTNESVELTFGTVGAFPYNCHIHPGMTGTVVVR